MHKDLVTLERGGPSPYRAVEPWLLLLYNVDLITIYSSFQTFIRLTSGKLAYKIIDRRYHGLHQ
jgi:hypothetical protein